MWNTEASHVTTAHPGTVWRLWRNVPEWNAWDESLTSSSLDGDFVVGNNGTLTPRGAPNALAFQLLEVTPLQRFDNESHMPGTTLRFSHRLETTPQGTRITHRVTITGEAWQRCVAMLGAAFERDLPRSLVSLARLAEDLERARQPQTA